MKLFFILAILSLASVAFADIPAHCLYTQVLGTWRLDMSDNNDDSSITCSTDAFTVTGALHVRLALPNIVYNTSSSQIGIWTMMYDEGINIRLLASDLVTVKQEFFAYFPYVVDPSSGNVTTYCNYTSISSYHDGIVASGAFPKNWGCFIGYKASYFMEEKVNDESVSVASSVSTYKPQSPVSFKSTKYVADHAFVNAINKAQSSWTAAVNPELVDQPIGDVLRRSGQRIKRGHNFLGQVTPPKTPISSHSANSANSARSLNLKQKFNIDATPTNFNWRNVSGIDFVGPMRDQLSCGSCYAFSTNEMVQARIRVATNNQVTPFLSPQRVVSCSDYSQGCDGGFEFLVSKYGQDYGLTDEACFPYASGILPSVPCSAQCSSPKYYTVDSFNYVGEYYGNCNEELMIQELLSNGPMAVSFNVYDDFLQYRSGIYHHVESTRGLGINPWEVVSHSVLLIGYGVDESSGEKYWRVANSWGRHSTDYGGDFLIRRGTNECSIESAAVYAIPSLRNL